MIRNTRRGFIIGMTVGVIGDLLWVWGTTQRPVVLCTNELLAIATMAIIGVGALVGAVTMLVLVRTTEAIDTSRWARRVGSVLTVVVAVAGANVLLAAAIQLGLFGS